MRIYLTALLFTFLTMGVSTAQHVNLGFKAGLNVYNIQNEGSTQSDSKVDFHIGLLGHIHIGPHFGIQPEIIYSRQGATNNFGADDNTTNLGYINIPVMFQYMFDYGFRLEAGPQLGFLLSGKNVTNGISSDIKDQLQTLDFGIGAGVSYVHVPSGFGVDLRYNLGLSDISKQGTVKSTNRGIQLGVFYLLKHRS